MFKLIGTESSTNRINWLKKQLSSLPVGARILDAGAGELKFAPFCGHLDYVSQDFGQYDGKGDTGALQTGEWNNDLLDIVSDITDIPVDDASFDVILCTEVFEHIPDAVAALAEFNRILKPGGTLILTAPFASLTHFAPYHFCGYNKYWYEHHLSKLNFDIQILEPNGSWFQFVAQELRRSRFMGRKYSSSFWGLLTRLSVIPIIILLSIQSKYDRGSNEAMCYNYIVRARKN